MVRALAGYDTARVARVAALPVRDALGEYWLYLRDRALADYTLAVQLYHQRACLLEKPGKPPTLPPILQDRP